MAFTLEDIHAVRDEETKRDKLPLSDTTRTGLERHFRDDGVNPGRHTFKRISLRDIPDFTANDHQLRIVVAQTAYNHFAKHGRWERIPEEFTIDPMSLNVLIATRLDKQSVNRPDLLTKFNTTKDYVACLSAVAYLKWRVRLHHKEIATCLRIPEGVVQTLAWRLRENAVKLGMSFKRRADYRGPKPYLTHDEFCARMQEVAVRPGHKEKQSASLKKIWTPEYKAEQHRKGRWKGSGRKPGTPCSPELKVRYSAERKGIPQPWTPERKAAFAARRKQIELERFLKTVAWG